MGTLNFVLIGARNTGKTCYLAILASHCSSITTARDETTSYLKMQRQLLDAGDLPQATASTLKELYFRYAGDGHKVEFSIDDYDGSFIENLSHQDNADDESRNELKAKIQESEGLLFFMPYETEQDEKALSNFEDEINTIITLVEEITQGKYAALPIPVAICVTKWDRSPNFKQENEMDAALEYIHSNPYYQRAYAKISKLFKHVVIHPISAFGQSDDGTHPNRGKINPYRVEAPLKDCLNQTFQRFEERISEFQSSDNKIELLTYLYELYDDLRHYKNGEYCQLYNELEQEFSQNVLNEINQKKQTTLTTEQQLIYELIRDESLAANIDHAISNCQKRRSRNKILISVVLLFLMTAPALYYLVYSQQNAEKMNFTAVSESIDNPAFPISEKIKKAVQFNQHWKKPLGLPLPSWSLEPLGSLLPPLFIDDTTALSKKTDKAIRTHLQELMDQATGANAPDAKIIRNITMFRDAVNIWDEPELRQTVHSETQPVLESYQILLTIKGNIPKASDLNWKEYEDLKSQADHMTITWSDTYSILDNIYQIVGSTIRSDAKVALKSNDLNELETSAEALLSLANSGNEAAKQLLLEEITPALAIATRQKQLSDLLGELNAAGTIPDFVDIINQYWTPAFTENDRDEISKKLQAKYEEFDRTNLPVIQNLHAMDEIKGIRDKLAKINTATAITIQKNDEENPFLFHYHRPEETQKAIAKWEEKLNRYEKALDQGIFGYITFIGKTAADDDYQNPLGFNCSYGNDDLKIMIDKGITLNDNDDEQYICQNHSLKWKISVHLSKGSHQVQVLEIDPLYDDPWHGNFELNGQQILEYLNSGQIDMDAAPYILRMTKR